MAHLLMQYAPWLIAMALLMLCSAFFSTSEAAFFYLSRSDRRRLATGSRAQRVASGLLADPDRLLTAVLFWNLMVNVGFFTIVSITSLDLKQDGLTAEAGSFAAGSLVAMIVFSEMLPKSVGVLRPRSLAVISAIPLAAMVRVLDPVLPVVHMANLLSRRLLWPRFRPEPYLRVGDLERAVQLSTSDATLLEQEQRVLQNIVSLSEIPANELMRPRVQFLVFRPPVSLADLQGQMPPSGYLLVAEPDSDEVTAAISLRDLSSVPTEQLERHAEPVVYVPWCTPVAQALETMQRQKRRVAAVVNELGETIGILTFDDVLETIFGRSPSRSQRLLEQVPIRQVGPGIWHVTGMTSLRRLVRHFGVPRPPSRSVTVTGVVQETLGRMARPGDRCHWGPFQFTVLHVLQRGRLLVELTLAENGAEEPVADQEDAP